MSTAVDIDEKIEQVISTPDRYKVILLNDDHTPMDFVIEILTTIFKHTPEDARDLTMKIHQEGSAVCGVYSFELAEQKSIEATTLSRNAGFPLQIRIEKD
jgi:ATP-dependent Clp protease adaptor protein ClpS|tara:strand:- start:4012 stop:4311 length:300 start_codon:yes stop_codon:yes gene_type:complete